RLTGIGQADQHDRLRIHDDTVLERKFRNCRLESVTPESGQSTDTIDDELISVARISSAIPVPGAISPVSENEETSRILIDKCRRAAADSILRTLASDGSPRSL